MIFERQVAPTIRAPAEARRSLAGLEKQLESGMFQSLQLIVNELVSNSVRHASLTDDDWIEVVVSASSHTIRGAVTHPGQGFEPHRHTPQFGDISGWGLTLVDRIADRWGVSRNGVTRVWFELDRPADRR